jgi:hypothetical protein
MALSKIQAESMNLADTYAFTGTVSGTPQGVTMVDQFMLTSSLSLSSGSNVLTANIARYSSSTRKNGTIGTGMSQSSGVFTFPSTGIYRIDARGYIYHTAGFTPYISIIPQLTPDNGNNWYDGSVQYSSCPNDGNAHTFLSAIFIFDCQDTSTHKARFRVASQSSGVGLGGSSTGADTSTHFIFTRLGDT